MNQSIKVLLGIVCAGVMVPCAWGQAAKAGRQALKGLSSASKPVSALGRLDARVSAAQRAVSHVRPVKVDLPSVPVKAGVTSAARARVQFDAYAAKVITPTPSVNLRPRLVSPTVSQTQEAVQQYEQFFADFSEFHKYINPMIGNALLENVKLAETLHPTQIGRLAGELRGLEMRASKLQRLLFPNDPALKDALEYISFASQEVNKFYTPEVAETSHAVRPYVQDEFWMEFDWHKGKQDETLKQLPENVHMVVLNDTKDILNMYKQWEREGRFPQGWKISVYEDTKELLEAVEAGTKFDLVISDINVPGGGGRYFVNRLREMGVNTPVIGCSMYTRDKIDSQELHQIGFDGYMYGDDMFEESAGFYKWNGYIKNYYYYKRIGNWPR